MLRGARSLSLARSQLCTLYQDKKTRKFQSKLAKVEVRCGTRVVASAQLDLAGYAGASGAEVALRFAKCADAAATLSLRVTSRWLKELAGKADGAEAASSGASDEMSVLDLGGDGEEGEEEVLSLAQLQQLAAAAPATPARAAPAEEKATAHQSTPQTPANRGAAIEQHEPPKQQPPPTPPPAAAAAEATPPRIVVPASAPASEPPRATASEEVWRLKMELQEKTRAIRELEARVAMVGKVAAERHDEVEQRAVEARVVAAQLEEEKARADAEVARLRAANEQQATALAAAQSELAAASEAAAKSTSENRRLQGELARLAEFARIQEQLEAELDAKERLVARLQREAAAHVDSAALAAQFERDRSFWQSTLAALQRQQQQRDELHQHEAERLQGEMRRLQATLAETRDEAQALNEAIAAKDKSLRDALDEHSFLQADHLAAINRIAECDALIAKMEKERAEMRAARGSKGQDAAGVAREAEAATARLEAELQTSRRNTELATRRAEELRVDNIRLRADVTALNNAKRVLQRQVVQETAKLQALETRCGELETQLSREKALRMVAEDQAAALLLRVEDETARRAAAVGEWLQRAKDTQALLERRAAEAAALEARLAEALRVQEAASAAVAGAAAATVISSSPPAAGDATPSLSKAQELEYRRLQQQTRADAARIEALERKLAAAQEALATERGARDSTLHQAAAETGERVASLQRELREKTREAERVALELGETRRDLAQAEESVEILRKELRIVQEAHQSLLGSRSVAASAPPTPRAAAAFLKAFFQSAELAKGAAAAATAEPQPDASQLRRALREASEQWAAFRGKTVTFSSDGAVVRAIDGDADARALEETQQRAERDASAKDAQLRAVEEELALAKLRIAELLTGHAAAQNDAARMSKQLARATQNAERLSALVTACEVELVQKKLQLMRAVDFINSSGLEVPAGALESGAPASAP